MRLQPRSSPVWPVNLAKNPHPASFTIVVGLSWKATQVLTLSRSTTFRVAAIKIRDATQAIPPISDTMRMSALQFTLELGPNHLGCLCIVD
jgi:hypothetical protein